jgi:hypothetical protein
MPIRCPACKLIRHAALVREAARLTALADLKTRQAERIAGFADFCPVCWGKTRIRVDGSVFTQDCPVCAARRGFASGGVPLDYEALIKKTKKRRLAGAALSLTQKSGHDLDLDVSDEAAYDGGTSSYSHQGAVDLIADAFRAKRKDKPVLPVALDDQDERLEDVVVRKKKEADRYK